MTDNFMIQSVFEKFSGLEVMFFLEMVMESKDEESWCLDLQYVKVTENTKPTNVSIL